MKRKNRITIYIICLLAALLLCVLVFPVMIVMNGEKTVTVPFGEVYEDPGARVRFGLGSVRTEGNVDTSQLGDQTVTYRFLTEKAKRTIRVVDTERPVISLEGAAVKYLVKGEAYTEPGYSAYDACDGDLTDLVEVETDLDVNTPGDYHVSYTVTDKAGNAARERRQVSVVENGPFSADRISFDLGPFYDDVICRETPYDEERYSKLLFFGDSFIGNLGDYGVVSYSQLWSRGSLGTDSVYDAPITAYGYYDGYSSFFSCMDAYAPKEVLVLLNSDRTLHWTPEYLSESCDSFYKNIKERYPDTEFIICSITPVDPYYSSEGWMQQEGFDRNDRINKMNANMCELCKKYGFRFMNAAESLKDPSTGCCRDGYIGDDGIHLSYDGYVHMLEYIKGHMDW